jgi:signal transduction histidine kinase
MNIRTKLAFRFALTVAPILLFFSVGVYFFLAQFRQEEFYRRLEEKALTIARFLFEVEEVDHGLLKTLDQLELTSLRREEITIYDTTGTLIFDSGSDSLTLSPAFLQTIRRNRQVRARQGDTEILGLQFTHQHSPYYVVVSAVDEYGLSKLRYLGITMLIGCAISVAMVIIAGWRYAGSALKPITQVITQVDQIEASRLHARVQAGQNNDEIAQLAATFNRMLNRLEEAFILQKQFVSNASHEIKTPITAITGQVEVVLMQERSQAEYVAVLRSILEDMKNLSQLTFGLLSLAKVSADASTFAFQPLRVDELLWLARDYLVSKIPAYRVHIHFEEPPDDEETLRIRGVASLLQTAFVNLMENGCKYSADQQVNVYLRFRPGAVQVLFADQGMGIAEKDLPYVFEPFFRASNATDTGGYGIGLPLTRKIILLHGGIITIESQLAAGTTVTVQFPQEAAPAGKVRC